MDYTCTICGGKMEQIGIATFECIECGAVAYALDDESDELTFEVDMEDFEWDEHYQQFYE